MIREKFKFFGESGEFPLGKIKLSYEKENQDRPVHGPAQTRSPKV